MKIFGIVLTALIMAGFAGAGEDTSAPAASTTQEGAPVGTQVQTAGKVTAVHSCPMVGIKDEHMIVKLQTEQGDTDIVDLGPTSELKSNGIEPKEGQKLWIDGRVGQINDKFLIVADQISETKMITVARTAPLTQETVKHAEARGENNAVKGTEGRDDSTAVKGAAEVRTEKDPNAVRTETVDADKQIRTVEGTITHSRRLRIEGQNEEHVFAKLQTASGIAVVDLGTCAMMPSTVNIADGQNLAVSGYIGRMNNKPIIYAETVGNTSRIQRAADSAPAQTPATNTAPVK